MFRCLIVLSLLSLDLAGVLQVIEEADLDDDGKLSYVEFEHVISRAPDFLRSGMQNVTYIFVGNTNIITGI